MMFLIYPTHSQHHILLLARLRSSENMCVCEWAGEEIHPRNNRLRRRWLWTPRLETFFVFVNIYNYLFCGRPLPLGICRWQIACRRHQGKASGVLLCWLAKPSIHAHSPKPRLERGETPYTRTLDKPPERRFCLFIIHGSNTRLIITPINDVWKARKNRPSSYSRRDVGTSGDKNGSCSVHQRWTVLCEFGERTSRAGRDYSSSSNNHLTCRVCPTLIKSNFPCFWVAFRIIRWRLVLINIWLVLIIVLLYPCSKVHGKPSKQLLSPFIHSFIQQPV